MRLSTKLVLAITVAIVFVAAVSAYVRIGQDRDLLIRDMARDHRLLGRAMRAVVEAIAAGRERPEHVLTSASASTREIHMRTVRLLPSGRTSPPVPLTGDELARIRRGRGIDAIRDGRFLTFVPIHIGQPIVLELDEPLDDIDYRVRALMLYTLAETTTVAIVCSLLVVGLAFYFVGRPLRMLQQQARRIGAGDLTPPAVLHQHDEVGELSTEMSSMCARLEAAHKLADEQTQARIGALEQLRHADRLRTVGQLASGLAHELGTPLNVVSGRAQIIASGDLPAEENATNAHIIIEQASRMAGLIRQLLDYARRQRPKRESVDLGDLVGSTAGMLAQLAQRRGVEIVVSAPGSPLGLNVDVSQIQQAITNLVVNAVQAMSKPGKVEVRLDTDRAAQPEVGGPPRPVARIEVRDEGVGIAPEHLPRVFEPFFTTKGTGEGTGLGLSVTEGIVRDHQGWLTVQSELGRGSCFTMYLPLSVAGGSGRPEPAR